MIEAQDLDAAVDAEILTAGQRDRLIDFARERRIALVGADEEQFRFITGFNDIFVTIAVVLVLVAMGTLGERVFMNARGSGPAVAIASWLLAEYFTRRRRMALPSIVLLLSFVGALYMFGLELLREFPVGDEAAEITLYRFGFAALLAVGGAAAHWWRFRVPITIAAGAAAASGVVITAVTWALGFFQPSPEVLRDALAVIGMLCGGAVFALAMRFDMTDRERVTRRTDIAFWLHLLAAPLIVHPLFVLLGVFNQTDALAVWKAIVIVAVYIALTVIALAIDRRALLVSALGYVIYAISALFRDAVAVDMKIALTSLVIGLFLVMLSAAWRQCRMQVVVRLPEALAARLPAAT